MVFFPSYNYGLYGNFYSGLGCFGGLRSYPFATCGYGLGYWGGYPSWGYPSILPAALPLSTPLPSSVELKCDKSTTAPASAPAAATSAPAPAAASPAPVAASPAPAPATPTPAAE